MWAMDGVDDMLARCFVDAGPAVTAAAGLLEIRIWPTAAHSSVGEAVDLEEVSLCETESTDMDGARDDHDAPNSGPMPMDWRGPVVAVRQLMIRCSLAMRPERNSLGNS